MYEFLISHTRVTTIVNLILLDCITLITFGKRHKVRSPAFCNFLHSPASLLLSPSLFRPKIISSEHYTKVSRMLITEHLQEV